MKKIILLVVSLMATSLTFAGSWCSDKNAPTYNLNLTTKAYVNSLEVGGAIGYTSGILSDSHITKMFPNGYVAISMNGISDVFFLPLDQPWADAALATLNDALMGSKLVQLRYCSDPSNPVEFPTHKFVSEVLIHR